jgi:hypothetical protein
MSQAVAETNAGSGKYSKRIVRSRSARTFRRTIEFHSQLEINRDQRGSDMTSGTFGQAAQAMLGRGGAVLGAVTATALPIALSQATPIPNDVAGTWRMVSATLEENGKVTRPYGENPAGMLVFTPDLYMVEVLTNRDSPRFASDQRGGGTDAENRRAMASSIGFFGTYTVDGNGRFTGNRVEGATFPNWVGSVRTTRELTMEVRGERMFETFTRPDGGKVRAEFQRVDKPD